MRLVALIFALMALYLTLGGCASHPPVATAPTAMAPWTGSYVIASHAETPSRYQPSQLLSDGDLVILRGEKFVTGPMPLTSISAQTTYTFDAQPIGVPGGWGYRYRTVVQESVSVP